jgi:hypothetical protein
LVLKNKNLVQMILLALLHKLITKHNNAPTNVGDKGIFVCVMSSYKEKQNLFL